MRSRLRRAMISSKHSERTLCLFSKDVILGARTEAALAQKRPRTLQTFNLGATFSLTRSCTQCSMLFENVISYLTTRSMGLGGNITPVPFHDKHFILTFRRKTPSKASHPLPSIFVLLTFATSMGHFVLSPCLKETAFVYNLQG